MKKFIALLCLTALLTGCGRTDDSGSSKDKKTSEPASSETLSDPADDDIFSLEASYRNVLDELKSQGAESFSVFSITGGTGPDVLAVRVKDGDISRIKLYRYQQDSGEAKLFGTFDNSVSYAAGSELIMYSDFDQLTNKETTTFFSLSDDDKLTSETSVLLTYGVEAGSDDQFQIDERSVDEPEFREKMQELRTGPVRELGTDFNLDEDVIDAVFGSSSSWQDAYSKYLSACLPEVAEEDGAGFSVFDINGDDIPELFYAPGFYHVSPVKVLTFNGGLSCLGSFGSYGGVSYIPETSELLSSNMGMGYYSGAYYTLGEDNVFKMTFFFDDNSGAVDLEGGEEPVYKINGQPVSSQEYNETLNSRDGNEYYYLGRDNDLTEENVKALAEGRYTAPEVQYAEIGSTDDIPPKFKSILSKFYYSCQLDLTDLEITGSENISDNTFAIYDVDCDGKDELIIDVTATFMAEMVTVIYGEDDNGDVKVELITSPNYTIYENGLIEAGVMHNQGKSGRFWPYAEYKYYAPDDEYLFNRNVYGWDKEIEPEGFLDEVDKDGDGLIYYIGGYDDPYDDYPMDLEALEKWCAQERENTSPVILERRNITEDVIS